MPRIDWSNPEAVKKYRREYQREYHHRRMRDPRYRKAWCVRRRARYRRDMRDPKKRAAYNKGSLARHHRRMKDPKKRAALRRKRRIYMRKYRSRSRR